MIDSVEEQEVRTFQNRTSSTVKSIARNNSDTFVAHIKEVRNV